MPSDTPSPAPLVDDAPLAPLTTLELGGRARHLATVLDDRDLADALRWAADAATPVAILGGGSNMVVADAGFDGVVVRLATRGVQVHRDAERVVVTAAAGEPWDELVARTVAEGWAGLECLSGIPGTVGATPIQNVGAYGQDVAETISAVEVLDRATLRRRTLEPAALRFGYRDSALRRRPGRFVVTAVRFALRAGGAPAVRYAELRRALGMQVTFNAGESAPAPSLAAVRETVIALRRGKSMVIDPEDPNRRSAGSFFTNPIVGALAAERVAARAVARGVVAAASEMPRFPAPDHRGRPRVKLAAGWLIERAGIARGLRRGAVGISSRHALALVHHGGGSTAELVALAAEVVATVHDAFGVTLRPEPVFLGFAEPPLGGAGA